jgi:hypothetical protein
MCDLAAGRCVALSVGGGGTDRLLSTTGCEHRHNCSLFLRPIRLAACRTGRTGNRFRSRLRPPPNEDAAAWFARDIWPVIRAEVPGAHLSIIGSNPTARVRALAGDGVAILANVSDAELATAYDHAPRRRGAVTVGRRREAESGRGFAGGRPPRYHAGRGAGPAWVIHGRRGGARRGIIRRRGRCGVARRCRMGEAIPRSDTIRAGTILTRRSDRVAARRVGDQAIRWPDCQTASRVAGYDPDPPEKMPSPAPRRTVNRSIIRACVRSGSRS